MKKENRFFFVLFIMTIMAITGCVGPGQESYNLGKQLIGQDRLDEAIVKYEQAVAQEPDNPEYKQTLGQVKMMLAGKLKERVKATLSQASVSTDQFKTALEAAEKARKLVPTDQEAALLLDRVKAAIESSDKKARRLADEATQDIENNRWAAAVLKMREIKRLFPNDQNLSGKLTKIENQGLAYYQKEAQRDRAADDWEQVLQALTLAQEIAPTNPAVISGLKEAKEKHVPGYYLSRAEAAAKKGQWDRVIDYTQKASLLDKGGANGERINSLSLNAAGFFIGQATQNPKKLVNAYTALLLAKEYKGDPKTKALTDQLLNLMYERAVAYENSGQTGNALVWYDNIAKFTSDYKDVFTKIQDMKDRVRERVIKKIAVMDFTSPATNADAGRIVTDSLLGFFTAGAVKNVKVLARDVLGTVLKEIEMGQAGLFDFESAKKAGKLKGTDVFIFGSVLQYKVETTKNEGQKMASVVVGKKTVPNPSYQMWLMSQSQKGNSKEEGQRATPAPSPTINEEIRETVKYKVGTEKKRATVSISFRLIDVEEGEVVITKTLNKVIEANDDFSEGIAFANIPYKAINLPADSELLDKATQAVTADLGKAVLSHFENPKTLYLNTVESLKKKRAYERAIEKYTDLMYYEELKEVSTPLTDTARREIIDLLSIMGR